ncbi:MAG: L,D-transpeptidase, partial [Candidatus Latescibacterota bacterium]
MRKAVAMLEMHNTFARFLKSISASFMGRAYRLFNRTGGWTRSVYIRHVREFSIAFACSCSLVLTVLILVFAPTMREWMLALAPASRALPGADNVRSREVDRLQERIRNLQLQYNSFTPRKPYLIVDTSTNRFQLMTGIKILREGICSTGSYVHLQAGDDRQWVFKTPRGRFHVQMKEKAPMWYKPDWAFVEEGVPVPAPFAPERYEMGVL